MSQEPPLYDLVLLLVTSVPDERRAKIVADVQAAISNSAGSVVRNDDWGTRQLAYQIDHKPDAEYHLIQFTGPTALLETLSHSLKIDDAVLRFRIIKVLPGTPPPADMRPAPGASASPPAPAPVPTSAAADASGS
jgi:small subunit ribosomal protein S6